MKKAVNAAATDPVLAERKQQLLELIGAFCDERLNADYKRLCKKAVERLAKKRPSPVLRGKPENLGCRDCSRARLAQLPLR